MCLIISAPKGSMIPKEVLADATRKNGDGWGVMYHDGRKIVSEKSHLPDVDAIYDLTKNNPHETIVHLRMTTHGGNTMDNTHPFEIVPNRLLMMHNGVVDVDVPWGSKKSDTRVMVEDYIKPLVGKDPSNISNRGLRNFIQSLIGNSSNRLVFLDDAGKLTYFNKNLGIEWKGMWCSNTYAWTLHTEHKKTADKWGRGAHLSKSLDDHYVNYLDDWRYDRYWGKDTTTKHIGKATTASKGIYDDEFKWADKNVQAADDESKQEDDDVETEFGFIVPAWAAYYLQMTVQELEQEDPYDLACVIENLRDTYIGAPL